MKSNTVCLLLLFFALLISCQQAPPPPPKAPNILFAISDDQSFAHTSFAGSNFVSTPGFDRVAREGIYFSNCYAGSPGCAPSRCALVTGRHHWQNEQSGQHASSWLKKHVPFVDLLSQNGYTVGRTGKGVGPFRYASSEEDSLWRKGNAAGPEHSQLVSEPYASEISKTDYAQNFKHFMENVRGDKPFFFWYGGREPHRAYEKGAWKRLGKKLEDVEVPEFFPDNDEIRGDLLDYAVEIEWFDLHLQRMLEYLEEIGELENTLVIVTSDNGMPFPRAKANCYEYGAHVPLAIRYPKSFGKNRRIEDPVGFIELAPTLLEITGTSAEAMLPITGKSILNLLQSEKSGVISEKPKTVFSGRERHSCSRYQNWGYPQRAVRQGDYLYIWNLKSDRWPSGAPQRFDPKNPEQLWPMHGLSAEKTFIPEGAYTDIDDCPTKTYLIEHFDEAEVAPYFHMTVDKRPEVELFDVVKDPYCLNNLAGTAEAQEVEVALRETLMAELRASEDPRIVGQDPEVFDSYKRYSHMRFFPKPENAK